MRKLFLAIPVALIAILSPAVLRASDITYAVDESVGGTGSVTGTITTNGATGTLDTADILNWNLDLNDGVNTFDLDGSTNSGEDVIGSDLTATATELLFNFSGTDDGAFVFENPTVGGDGAAVCYSPYGCGVATGGGVVVTAEAPESTYAYTALSGNDVIATASPSAVPEPGSLFLLGSGILGLAGAARRKFAA